MSLSTDIKVVNIADMFEIILKRLIEAEKKIEELESEVFYLKEAQKD